MHLSLSSLTRLLAVALLLLASAACGSGADAGDSTEQRGTTSPTAAGQADGSADGSGAGSADGSAGDPEVAASCIAAVTYQGELYIQVAAAEVEKGEGLSGAEVPACNDTGGTDETATPVDAFAISGVDARYAVMSESPGGQFVYVVQTHAPGFSEAEPLPKDVKLALGLE